MTVFALSIETEVLPLEAELKDLGLLLVPPCLQGDGSGADCVPHGHPPDPGCCPGPE